MDRNITGNTHDANNNQTEINDVRILATSYILYKIGDGISKYYFLVLVPVGISGNVLSFMVMIQRHNRHMSFSLYIAVLAVADTLTLFLGFLRYLNMVHNVDMLPNQYWHCILSNTLMLMSSMCSTLFILSMTFDRFYSIMRPHKAASFNTVKRARISIFSIITFSILYNIPHLFVTLSTGKQCVPYGNAIETTIGQFYYWLSFVINYAVPFVLLLIMNCFIIQTIRNRSKFNRTFSNGRELQNQGQGQSEGQSTKVKQSENHIYITLLFVTFGFLILTTPAYVFLVYIMFVNYLKSPYSFAVYYFFYHFGHKLYNTNYGINFFLYVISGRKFRTDLLKLFGCFRDREPNKSAYSVSLNTITLNM